MFGLALHLLGLLLPLYECLDPSLPPVLQTGSIYVTPFLEGTNCVIKNYGPKHALYAMTPETFFNIVPNWDNIQTTTPTWLHQVSLDDMPEWVKPHENKPVIKTEVAIALAKRMLGVTFRYRIMRCNCRHYVDYLKYGRTFGRWWDFTYMTISEDCPLHGRFTSDSKVNTLEFKLYDKNRNPVELAPPSPPTRPPQLPLEFLPSVNFESDSGLQSDTSVSRRHRLSPKPRWGSSSRQMWASSPARNATPSSPTRRKSTPTRRRDTPSPAPFVPPTTHHLKPSFSAQLSTFSQSCRGDKSRKESSFRG